jgi:hypothetical protein
MKKTIKVSDVTNAVSALNELNNEKLPFKLSLKVARIISELDVVLKTFQDNRNKLIKELSTDGQKVDEDKVEVFTESMQAILSEDVELNFNPVLYSELEAIDGLTITPANLSVLDGKFLVEKE